METLTYHTEDKSSWADGPWKSEPDKKQWQDPATGLPCLIVRGPSGALCGYVGVPEGHPAYGKDYDHHSLYVHGGLTFGGRCQPGEESHSVCHIPGEGESDNVWWLGFDCAHIGDKTPRTEARLHSVRETPSFMKDYIYRDFPYVEAEVSSLAAQLAEIANAP